MPVFNPILIGGRSSSTKPAGPPDPVEVYRNTRPADWLPMPEPQENEMYLLVHIPDGASALLAFTATFKSEIIEYPEGKIQHIVGIGSIWLGTIVDGKFSPIQNQAQEFYDGQKYETELFADDYGNLTSDGMKQVMIKVSGDILTWEPSTHSKKTSPSGFKSWNIVEISCNLPSATSVGCNMLSQLRYFTMSGTNQITNMSYMFYYCRSLTSIPQLDTSSVITMSYMFSNCSSLISIPQLDTSNVTNMSRMFEYCYSLTSIPQLDTSSVTNMSDMFNRCSSLTSIPQLDTSKVTKMSSMFYYCYSLSSIPQLDTSNVTDMSYMFYECSSLTSIPQLNTSKVADMSGMFYNCYSLISTPQLDTSSVTTMRDMFGGCDSLTSVVLQASAGWVGDYITLRNCSLGKAALETLINNLPTLASSKELTLTGNPGVSELTDEIKAVASSKGWTLVL